MATKWAVASGNWNNTAVWNGGTIPQEGDSVYMNGYNVTINTDINIGNGLITNKTNPETSRTGGALAMPSTTTRRFITANIECGDVPMIIALGGNITINGNVETGSLDGVLLERVGGTINLIIVGNVTTQNGNLVRFQSGATLYSVSLSINGNVVTNVGTLVTSFTSTNTITINGNIVANARLSTPNITTATIIGSLTLNYVVLQATTLKLTGKIEYKSNNNIAGILCTNFNILNLDTFMWHDITQPRSNPFIILTNADMNNTNQYPSPTNVKKDIPYAWGELIGTYLPDYPIEANVLYGVDYDNHNMTGTLTIPSAPTTSDIVTAIKNDSDLGGKISTTNTNVSNISTAVTTIDGKVDIVDTNVDTLISRLTSVLTQRLGQSVTVEILQQILTAHLNN